MSELKSDLEEVKRTKVTDLDIIVRMINNTPYYEVKYKELGKDHYNLGYSSYKLDIVLGFIDEYFELVETITNSDQIRRMKDAELARFLCDISSCRNCMAKRCCGIGQNGFLDWLKEESNG